jgi:CRP-like cAMP-binding protein
MMTTAYAHSNDALNYLPRRPLTSYGKGAVIYSGSCQSLYLVVSGRVKVSSTAGDGWNVIIKIVQPEGLFGEILSGGSRGARVRNGSE